MYKQIGEWEVSAGANLHVWAIPLQFAIGLEDFARRWGIGVRVLCFTFGATKSMVGYPLVRGPRLHIE